MGDGVDKLIQGSAVIKQKKVQGGLWKGEKGGGGARDAMLTIP